MIKTVCFRALAASALLIGLTGLAAGNETVTATDGRTFLLKSDGTYEEVKAAAPPAAAREISLTDLKLDIKDISGQRVTVRGKMLAMGDIGMLSDPKEMMDMTSISVNIDALPRDQRKLLLTKCGDGCNLTVTGTVGSVLFQAGLLAESVSFK